MRLRPPIGSSFPGPHLCHHAARPAGGIENGGWTLAYTNEVPALLKAREGQRKYTDMNYSLGISLGSDGAISDVIPGFTGGFGGLGPP